MEDEELEFSNQEMFPNGNMVDMLSNCSMDSFNFIDEILKDTHACTHTHTCNLPGPDDSHKHTCYHVHTKIVPSPGEDKTVSDDTEEYEEKKVKRRPSGNREAVRKYRERKKARTASLEEEIVRLRALNQQLLKRLQGQAVLEAEVARLKCLLVDIRGRIEGEIGSFPYQKHSKSGDVYQNLVNLPGSYVVTPCNMQCNDQVYCLHPGLEVKSTEDLTLNGQGLNGCEFENVQCLVNQNSGVNELPDCGLETGLSNAGTTSRNKRKGEISNSFKL